LIPRGLSPFNMHKLRVVTNHHLCSIIFSCWTRTLDLIAKHLKTEKIVYLRIDGECLLSKRQRIIDRFASDKSVPVLLMTTGTGAFG